MLARTAVSSRDRRWPRWRNKTGRHTDDPFQHRRALASKYATAGVSPVPTLDWPSDLFMDGSVIVDDDRPSRLIDRLRTFWSRAPRHLALLFGEFASAIVRRHGVIQARMTP